MLQILLVASVILHIASCTSHSRSQPPVQQSPSAKEASETAATSPQQIDGNYEFMSETLTTTEPDLRSESRRSDEWIGLWVFQKGHFSRTLDKRIRPGWFQGLPKDPQELGFESDAGQFKVAGNSLELKINLSLNPNQRGKPITLQYHFNGDELVLIETLGPTKESWMRGQRVTVLRRIG